MYQKEGYLTVIYGLYENVGAAMLENNVKLSDISFMWS